jgi:uncharacterized protein (UPF0147 family)
VIGIEPPKSNALQPPKEEFDQKVRQLEKINSEHEKGSSAIAKEIRAAASAGMRAYDNEDQAALSNAWKALQELEEIFKDEPVGPGKNDRPPMWMACTFFAQQILELIGKYQMSKEIPPAARKEYDPYVQGDMRTCREIMGACRFMPSDEECMPHLQSIREMYPRWEAASKLMGISLPKAP